MIVTTVGETAATTSGIEDPAGTTGVDAEVEFGSGVGLVRLLVWAKSAGALEARAAPGVAVLVATAGALVLSRTPLATKIP